MKSIKLTSLLFILSLFIFSSCDLDDGNYGNNVEQNNIPDTFVQYFGNEISRDFLGTVIDKNKLPIHGVTISIGNETAQTDGNGVFIIRDANVNERFGYVKAEKAGYIHGSRSVVPSEGTNKVNIMLLEANVVGTINSGSSETVSLSNGSSVSFDGNFIKEDGTAYSGSVDVIMHHLDPVDENISKQMPGMLYARNENGAERMLQTLGMLAVELRGNNGEDLNLAVGSASEIKMPVDVSLMGIAPATIPLWYFDEVNGYWKEEGEATLQGNMYVGIVSHFSFWNCDIPAEAISLCVSLTDENGNELANLNVEVTSSVFGTTNGNSNEKGEVCGFVPSNESLNLSIYNYDICGDLQLHTEIIGPFTSDSSIILVVPYMTNIISETVIGNLNNCDGVVVTDGYVEFSYENQSFISIVNEGAFEINILRCGDSNTFSIRGVNLENIQTTDTFNYTFSATLTDIGTISTCNVQEEFIEYLIDDEINVLFTDDIDVSFSSESFIIKREIEDNEYAKFLIILPSEIGSYVTSTNGDSLFNFTFLENNQHQYIFASQYGISVNVNSIGNSVGEYIDISFSGSFEDEGTTRSIEGTAHVLIDN